MAKVAETVNFDELAHLPLPTLVTDADGKLIYKNELASKYFNVRRGCSIYKFCDKETAEQQMILANAGVPSVITIRQSDNASCCLVIPKGNNLILTVIPYAFEFFGREALPVKSDNEILKNYFNQLEERISYVIDFLDGKAELITENANRRLKNNALKLMRLEKRIRTRLVENTDIAIRAINYSANKSVELCSFVSKITQMINSLSDVVGFRLIYIPRKDYSICNLNSTALAKLFIYISIFTAVFHLPLRI